jgi:ATP-binding cassette subfamily F protein 3
VKLAEMEHHWQEYSDQQEEIARLHSAIAHVRGIARFKVGGKADSGDKFAKGFFANRSKGTVRRARHLEHRLENLLTEERVEKPKADWQMKLEFESARRGGRDVWVCNDLAIGYAGTPLVSEISRTVRHGDRIAIVGANGSGKTTLLRTIAGSIPPVSGRVRLGSGIQVGYMEQEQEDLHPEWDALTTMLHLAPSSETDARAFLHKFLFSGDDVFIPVGNLSYGERARLSLACLVVQGRNFLLLDEPINHLDIPSRARFEQALANYRGTIMAVVHDRYFIRGFATEIWEIQQGQLLREVIRDDLLI